MSEVDPNYRPNIIYQLEDKIPARTAALVAVQHVMAMFIGVITMPLVVSHALKLGLADTAYLVSMGLFIPGISTCIQTGGLGPVGSRLPAIQGTSFAFLKPLIQARSVGGYVFAGSLFALGLTSWQVLLSLLIGIVIVNVSCNLVAKPSPATGTPYPVVCRVSFGVLGANIPAMIRGLLAVAWYGIQTYLASTAFVVVVLKFFLTLGPLADPKQHSFLGLSLLGWSGFLLLWVLQALVFWNGMETIKRFIDSAGPAVYLVMFLLAAWMLSKTGWKGVGLTLGQVKYRGWDAVIALALAAVIAASCAMLPALSGLANFSWFIGMFFGAFFYFLLMSRRPLA